MTISLSTGMANVQTAAIIAALQGGSMRIFSGTRPDSPDKAETGVLLGVVTVGGVPGAGLHYAASGSTLYKTAEQWAFEGLAAGTAAWFRLVAPGDTAGNTLSAPRIDGSIGTPGAPGDMTWEDLSVLLGLHYTLDSFLYLLQPTGH